jgi:putative copper export protein
MENNYQAPQADLSLGKNINNNSGYGESDVPEGVKGWSWGAFFLSWIWAIFNRTWFGLLALVPYVGLIFALILGFKGREWAWKNKRWQSVEHFNQVQKRWSCWGVFIVVIIPLIGILAAVAIPAYHEYVSAKGG